MTIQLQLRRGDNTANLTFTGAVGELTYNTTNNTLHIHDGVTQGGFQIPNSIALDDFLTASDLANYVTSTELNESIDDFLTASDLTNYVTDVSTDGKFYARKDAAWAQIYPFTIPSITTTALTSYTLTNSDYYVRTSSSSAVTISVNSATLTAPIGTQITIVQGGTGQITVQAAGSYVIYTSTTMKTRTRYSAATLVKISATEWDIGGDMAIS